MTDPSPDSHAPSLALIEQLAHDTIAALPEPFRAPATHIRLRVEEFAAGYRLTCKLDGLPRSRSMLGTL